jgi:contractile injection system tube protein
MTSAPISPRLLKAGLVLIDPRSSAVRRVITLQYNPDTLSRTLQTQSVSAASEGGNRSEALRLKGPPIETIKLDAEIDATDQMEVGDRQTAQTGIQSQLAALETIGYPSSDQLTGNNALARSGTLEIVPMESFLTLFVWSKSRILPVRITDFSVTEEAFDPQLNPIRAKVSLGMRVLSVDDLGFDSKGGSLFMIYQQQKERLASQGAARGLSALGIGALP